MRKEILAVLEENRCRGEIISIRRLAELQQELTDLRERKLLDEALYQDYLSGFKYAPGEEELPGSTAVIIVAIPQPATRVFFEREGKAYPVLIPPTYIAREDIKRVSLLLENILINEGYRSARAPLPQKMLAVRSGLGEYGRNNIVYLPGAGSFFRLASYFTDLPCQEDNWREPRLMEQCDSCFACLKKCPTGCITAERILIKANRCLAFFNESENDFPDWVERHWHNALVGCMICQEICPANRACLDNVVTAETFAEEETALLLDACPPEKLPAATRKKLEQLELLDGYQLLRRNLGALLNRE